MSGRRQSTGKNVWERKNENLRFAQQQEKEKEMEDLTGKAVEDGFAFQCRKLTRADLAALQVEAPDEEMYREAKKVLDSIAKPLDSLGEFEHIISRCGAMMRTPRPRFDKKVMIVMIADNGIVREGISQSGQDVTRAVAVSMGRRGSSVCKMAAASGAQIIPVDIGIAGGEAISHVLPCRVMDGTRDFLVEPAMTEQEVMQAIMTGVEIAKWCASDGVTMLGTGEMGIGNTTTSCAVASALLGIPVSKIVGRGAGASDEVFAHKREVIETALRKYGFAPEEGTAAADSAPGTAEGAAAERRPDAFEILRCVGGLDIAGLAGVFIGGAMSHIPVVIDGVISGAAALIAEMLVPGTKGYMVASHLGSEPALPVILEKLGLKPVIDARMALGEGTGAALFFSMLDTVMTVVSSAASFDEIAVEQYTRFH